MAAGYMLCKVNSNQVGPHWDGVLLSKRDAGPWVSCLWTPDLLHVLSCRGNRVQFVRLMCDEEYHV
jgi:hypothetical protein